MVNQTLIKQANSLKELLQLYFPIELYEYTKKIALDESFLNQAKKWPNATLDFSPYKDLEIITLAGKTTSLIFKTTEYPLGEIRKINVSKNKNLKELIIPNQELEGTLDLSANSQLEKINIANNLLNQLKVHGNFSQKLKGIASNYLQPQKHSKDKIHPVKDVNVILLDMSRKQKKSTRDLHEEKNQEFLQLKTKLESKFANDWQLSHLETLLISQEQIVRLSDANPQIIALSEREFQRVEKKLKEQLSEEEMREICQLKVEITKLKIELEEWQVEATQQ